jgi:uncharacterized protein
MRFCKAVNLRTGAVLGERVEVAATFYHRALGLLGRRALKSGAGMFIPGCSAIHTFFMLFPIDALFLDEHHRITKALVNMKPFRIAISPRGTKSVLELPCGTLSQGICHRGDAVSFSLCTEE